MCNYTVTNIDDFQLKIELMSGDLIFLNPGQTTTMCGMSVTENVSCLGSLIDSGHIIIDVINNDKPMSDFLWVKEGF
jgi:hypothetical protein